MAQPNSMHNILLEAGTNELEVLVFTLGSTRYGVNVAKVREVIGHVKLVSVPMSHPAILGVFKLRNRIIPLVDLQLYFEPGVPSQAKSRNVILMEFNDMLLGFLVDGVDRIFRMGWNDVKPMPVCHVGSHSVITSVCQADGTLALMVDFEKIAFDINRRADAFQVDAVTGAAPAEQRARQHVLLAEDSPTIRGAIRTNLLRAGYAQVTTASDGAEAWAHLEASLADEGRPPFTMVVTDIEMPRMDGLHLCKRIKQHPQHRALPVVVFSSLVSDSNLKKCREVGADAALTKPQMGRLVELLDRFLQRVVPGVPQPVAPEPAAV